MIQKCCSNTGQCIRDKQLCAINGCELCEIVDESSVVTEQGMFGDLSEYYQVSNPTENKVK